MRSRTVGAGHARPAAFQYVHAYPYKLEVNEWMPFYQSTMIS